VGQPADVVQTSGACQLGPEPELSRDVSHLFQHPRQSARQPHTEQLDRTAGRPEQAQQAANGRRLPCAVGSEISDDLPRVDAQGHTVDCGDPPVAFDQLLHFDGRAHAASLSKRPDRTASRLHSSHHRAVPATTRPPNANGFSRAGPSGAA
jgi:hypothetical protein